MKVVTAEFMRQIEQRAASEYGIDTLVMMENAGANAAGLLIEAYPENISRVLVVAGKGNNGGDGFVVARHLINVGLSVATILVGDPEQLKGDALTNWQILKRMSEHVSVVSSEGGLSPLTSELINCDLVVDAILGTGFRRPMQEFFQQVIELINSFEKPVVSLDVPSGLEVNTGLISGPVTTASMTITMGLPKQGFFHPEAMQFVGELAVADLGIPASLLTDADINLNLTDESDLPLLPDRPLDSHKGEGGRLFILAGSARYSGAAILAGKAALTSGASYVTVGVPNGISTVINGHLIEAIVEPLAATVAGGVSYVNKSLILAMAARADAVIIGPGLGMEEDTDKLIKELIAEINRPLILDADGLNILAGEINLLLNRKAPTLLTPHVGELARLLHITTEEVNKERFTVTKSFAVENKVHLLLKGPCTLITSPTGEQFINPSGGPELATAGTGDVLSGLLGSIAAQGLDLLSTALLGSFWHGLSGELAAEDSGMIKASDVADYLPEAYSLIANN